MSKRALKKNKRRSKAVLPALGIAGLSFSVASGATASTGEPTTEGSTSQSHEIFLGEEEVFDSSLSTFYTFDKENGEQTSLGQMLKLARGGGCGCGGHGGGCGGGGGCAARGCGGGGGCAARGCGGCGGRAGIVACRAGVRCAGVGRCAGFGVHCRCAFFRRCFGCGCGGGCGGWGCGTCWIWTPGWGWVNTCWGESTPPAKVASAASEPVAQIAKAEEKR